MWVGASNPVRELQFFRRWELQLPRNGLKRDWALAPEAVQNYLPHRFFSFSLRLASIHPACPERFPRGELFDPRFRLLSERPAQELCAITRVLRDELLLPLLSHARHLRFVHPGWCCGTERSRPSFSFSFIPVILDSGSCRKRVALRRETSAPSLTFSVTMKSLFAYSSLSVLLSSSSSRLTLKNTRPGGSIRSRPPQPFPEVFLPTLWQFFHSQRPPHRADLRLSIPFHNI